jgi:hypothetical protein
VSPADRRGDHKYETENEMFHGYRPPLRTGSMLGPAPDYSKWEVLTLAGASFLDPCRALEQGLRSRCRECVETVT